MRASTLSVAVLACMVLLCCSWVSADRASSQDKVAKYNSRVGAKFLADKAKEADVQSLPSGVLYKVIKQGDGATPTTKDTVKVHYAGTLITGTEFDSSYKRGQPAEFGVTGVIKGWTEILQLMPVGSTYEVYIPSDKAYGASGSGKLIGPNATLVFKIELIDIVGGGGNKRRPPTAPKRKAPKPADVEKAEL